MERKYFEISLEINGIKYAVRQEYDKIEDYIQILKLGYETLERLTNIVRNREFS